MFKKIILSFLAALAILTATVASPAYAQSTWYSQNPFEWYLKVYDTGISSESEIFGERYTAAQVQWIIYSIPSVILNLFPGRNFTTCVINFFSGNVSPGSCFSPSTGQTQPTQFLAQNYKSDESLIEKIVADRPLSGITYVKNKLRKFKLIPEAKAQGFGFVGALNPFQSLWKVSRDITYSLFVVATIIMAFMIMFRVKLSPQVVISVQSAIPKLVLGLILVTFSYAIAGFLVDLMYVVIGILSLFFSNAVSNIAPGAIPNAGFLFDFMTVGPGSIGVLGIIIIYLILFTIFGLAILTVTLGLLIDALIAILATVAVIAAVVTGLPALLAAVIIIIIAVVAIAALILFSLKITWMLVKTFTSVILLTIFAPLQILIGLFQPAFGFGAWVKNYVSNLAVFVVTGALFLLSYLFLILSVSGISSQIGLALSDPGISILRIVAGGVAATSIDTGTATAGWPPLLGATASFGPLLYLGISFVIFTMVPKTSEIIKGLIAGRPFAYGTAVGEAFGPISGAAAYAWGAAKGAGADELKTRMVGPLSKLGLKGRGDGPTPPPKSAPSPRDAPSSQRGSK